ncbi:MAG: L-threonylcarbamoyladenylate synthase [Gammaproteobacteria bacterium]
MSQYFQVHPENPQARLIRQAVQILRDGGVIVYPTDSCYALGCCVGDKSAMERIRRIRRLEAGHNFTLVCSDLSELAIYAKVDNTAYRLLKTLTPGPYTFILSATHEVPRRLQHPKRKTIGIRVPDHRIAQALLLELGEPIMSTTLVLPGRELPETDPVEIRERLERHVDLVIDGGNCGHQATTVVDLVDGVPEVVREGCGDMAALS